MDLSNISTNNLKKLRIYPDLRDDPLFNAVMRVMSDDICISKGEFLCYLLFKLSMLTYLTTFLFSC